MSRAKSGLSWRSLGLSAASGLLIFASYPPADLWPLAYVAFTPLLMALWGTPSWPCALILGLISGLLGYGPALAWVGSVTVPGWLGLSTYLSLYLAAGGVVFRIFQRRFPSFWPLPVALAWVALEFLRARLGPGFVWLFMGYTQHDLLPLVQLSTITGVYGLTFLTTLLSAGLAMAGLEARRAGPEAEVFRGLRAIPAIISLALAVGCYLVGLTMLRSVETTDGPTVGVVQQNIPRHVSDLDRTLEEFTQASLDEINKIAELSRDFEGKSIHLLVWSETVVTAPLNVSPAIIQSPELRRIINTALKHIRELGQRMGCHLLVGARTWFPRSEGYVERTTKSQPDAIGNSGLLYSPEGQFLERYDKIQLVPFGEYIPLIQYLPFLQTFTPFHRGLTPGDEMVIFELPGDDSAPPTKFCVLVCYEDVFPSLVRGFRQRGADFMVNITEEGWYHVPGELRQHLAMAKFRAVENRATVVRCANTGISCFIGPSGKIYRCVEKEANGKTKRAWITGTTSAPVRLCEETTFYTRHGDVFAGGCSLLAVAFMGIAIYHVKTDPAEESEEAA